MAKIYAILTVDGYTCMSSGCAGTPEESEADLQRTVHAGGLVSLMRLYPWHPAFSGSRSIGSSNANDTSIAIDLRNQTEPSENQGPKILNGKIANQVSPLHGM